MPTARAIVRRLCALSTLVAAATTLGRAPAQTRTQAQQGRTQPEAAAAPRRAASDADPSPSAAPAAAPSSSSDRSARERRLRWTYRPLGAFDYLAAGVLTGTLVAVEYGTPVATEANWDSPILFDESGRDAFRLESRQGRIDAAAVGDVFFYIPMVLPFIDSAVTPLVSDRWNFEVAWQLTVINVQAMSLSSLVARLGHRFVARARPDAEACAQDPLYGSSCGGRFASFPSGHTSTAMTGAGLMCAHHSRLALWGHPAADITACVASLAMGATTAVSRLMADRHWVSDTLVGAGLGFGVGYGLPVLFHYSPFWGRSANGAAGWMVHPWVSGDAPGMAVSGWL